MKRIFYVAVMFMILILPAQSFGEWFDGITDDESMYFAGTMNDSGNFLGKYCDTETTLCIWLLGISTACKEGDEYPVLANADTGSAHISVYCSAKLDNGLYRYVFKDYDQIDTLITKAMNIGFALPLQSDQFRVIRFELGGSNRAISKMLTQLFKNRDNVAPSKAKGTKDQII